MMKLAKKTITADTKMGSTKQIAKSFLLFYSLRDPNVKTRCRGRILTHWSRLDFRSTLKGREDALRKVRRTRLRYRFGAAGAWIETNRNLPMRCWEWRSDTS
jgi:hypothetical protein